MTPTEILEHYGVPLILIIGLILVFSFVILWTLKFFQYKRIKGSKYMSGDTLSLVEHSIIYLLLMILCLISFYTASRASHRVAVMYDSILKFTPILIVVFMILLLTFIVVGVVHRMFEYFKGNLSYKPKKVVNSRFLSFIELPLEYLVYTVGFLFAVVALFIAISNVTGRQIDLITPILQAMNDNLGRIILIIVLVLIFYLAYKFIDGFLRDIKEHSTRTNPQLIDLIRSAMKYVVALLGGAIIIFIVLEMAGLPYIGWITFAIVLFMVSLVIVIILSSPFRNSISGVMLMTTEPFNVGDRVRLLDETECEISRMGLLLTIVKTSSGELMEIPNSQILEHRIVNHTRSGSIRFKLAVEIAPDVERRKVEDLLLKAAIETEGVIDTKPKPEVYIGCIRPDAVVYELSGSISDLINENKVRSNIIMAVQEIFKKDGAKFLSICYIQDSHLKKKNTG